MCDTITVDLYISICHKENGAVGWARSSDFKEVVAFETRDGFAPHLP